jgi:hypothetical protein
MKIHVKDEDKPKRRSGLTVAMLRRHPYRQIYRDRRKRRAKDARNHWSKEWDETLRRENH